MLIESMLPEHLHERMREAAKRGLNRDGRFVLYWMHHALRGHENPALDLAIVTAEHLGLPVFVYQGLPERYPYASDRHHAFIMQGARDAHNELSSRNIGSAFHVERPGHRGSHLQHLASRSAVVVTDDLPTEPITGWVERLSAKIATPVWLVDTACVVPMKLVGRAYERAFAYRDATSNLLEKRLRQHWPEQANPRERFSPPDLPFTPVDLNAEEFHSLIAECEIDHSVGPVPHTLGGSGAGYSRWDEFKVDRLRRYAADRNDALRDGVSRLSAYLHYGMVSPLRIAREAAAVGGVGAEKFLDELLVWRELAYAFCYYKSSHDCLAALPRWAVDTLHAREDDPRPTILDWETLARGKTGDLLWDAAQRSLLMQGELHNNVRMTWGKAFLNWTPDAATALRLMIDLNHRFALDGRDPASYGGLLWCLGQFDRPHTPPQRIFGTVRTRPTDEHAKRLDPERYLKKVTRPWRSPMPRVAVVGAGLSGLICARTLQDHGFDVTLFEKSRGPGGRTATRRPDTGLSFDHGAQYFTVRDPHFARYVGAWVQRGIVAEWAGRVVSVHGDEVRPKVEQPVRYVGVPGMSAIARHLAEDVHVRAESEIMRLDRVEGRWRLTDRAGQTRHPFEHVVLSLPAPQAAALLRGHPLEEQVRAVSMTPCWAVLLAFRERVEASWDGAFVHDSPLAWVARNSSKPGRDHSPDCWVLHATAEWSRDHLEAASGEVAEFLTKEFARILPVRLPEVTHLDTQRWLFSASSETIDRQALFDNESGLTVCGDWLAGGRVEGAFRSGMAASGYILRGVGIPDGRERLPTSASSGEHSDLRFRLRS